ncbi:MAG: glycoside hydrolase [Planctomycetota bacterium]
MNLRVCCGLLIACLLLCVSGVSVSEPTEKKKRIPKPPVKAPAGYKWVLNEQYSDEFDGDELDRTKWNNIFPGWKGRPPGLFVAENVSVEKGFLTIKSTPLDPPQEDGKWTIACGAIQSVEQGAFYGYYETRVKASSVATSTTFWLKRRPHKDDEIVKSTELDIMEAVGNAQRFPAFATQMKSNTHVVYRDIPDAEGNPTNLKQGGNTNLPKGKRVNTAFHRYGCWWVDATTMHFYLNGKKVHTIEFPTDIELTPFDKPMFLNAVCETYSWEHPPIMENLKNDRLNTTRYDYIRAWTLEKIDAE